MNTTVKSLWKALFTVIPMTDNLKVDVIPDGVVSLTYLEVQEAIAEYVERYKGIDIGENMSTLWSFNLTRDKFVRVAYKDIGLTKKEKNK